jgi:hypothetical protein
MADEQQAPDDAGAADAGQAGGADTTQTAGPSGGGRKFGVGAVIGALVAGLVVAGVAGYLIGHSKGEDSGKKSGEKAGQTDVADQYVVGAPGYQRIYAAGRNAGIKKGTRAGLRTGTKLGFARGRKQGTAAGIKQGTAVGFQKGKAVGVDIGDQQGEVNGANAALGGFSDWSSGALYVVSGAPSGSLAYALNNRYLMAPGINYRLCTANSQKLCQGTVKG